MELYLITLDGWIMKEQVLLAIPIFIPLRERERLAWEQAKFLASYTDSISVLCLGNSYDRRGMEKEIESRDPNSSYIYENSRFYRYGKDCYLASGHIVR